MLVSPTERPPFNTLGETSSTPESLGVDFLLHSPVFGSVGVQRKEFSDLVASLADGRVTKEVLQMRDLNVGVWMIEGRPQWTTEGELLSAHNTFTRDSFTGVQLSLQAQGFWVIRTDSTSDSVLFLRALEKWCAKTEHKGFVNRPGARGVFGPASEKDWQIHFAMGLPGLGYERAREMVGHYGGLPFGLKEGVDLSEVKGIGKVTAKKIERMFGNGG